jgi:hypothetical protein
MRNENIATLAKLLGNLTYIKYSCELCVYVYVYVCVCLFMWAMCVCVCFFVYVGYVYSFSDFVTEWQ